MAASLTPGPDSEQVRGLVAALSVEDKARLTAGQDVWHLPGLADIGLHPLRMSDGPAGVRGTRWSTLASLAFPCGLAIGATFDPELVGALGDALGAEARSKNVHLLLGPTIGVVRTPLAGRTFESLSEDPWLTARLAVAYVTGVQTHRVGTCAKHFACNDQETERTTISSELDEVTLREVHLAPFEAVVTEAGGWALMAGYNRLAGVHCTEHPELLGTILRDDWGFDGVVVSDWLATQSLDASLAAGMDIEMPGPPTFYGARLADAVRQGRVDEADLDTAVARILGLAERTGALGGDGDGTQAQVDDPDRRRLARRVATAGTVLLANDGILPLDPGRLERVALVGPLSSRLSIGGGGSSLVTPLAQQSLLAELRDRLPDVQVDQADGPALTAGFRRLDVALVGGSFEITYLDSVGRRLGGDTLRATAMTVVTGEIAPDAPDGVTVLAEGTFEVDRTGRWTLGLGGPGSARLLLDDSLVVESPGALVDPGPHTAEVDLVAGQQVSVRVELATAGLPITGFEVLAEPPGPVDPLVEAVATARDADVAIVVVGADERTESEGLDRPGLDLVADQAALIEAVAHANPRTIVVLNTGGPVDVSWAEKVAAVATVWYPGEEGAAALADVLTGRAEPGGRLPVSFPRRISDTAAHGNFPGEGGVVTYAEGLLVGYRHHDATGVAAAYPFGHGLGYTTFQRGEPTVAVAPDPGTLTIGVPVTNTGQRTGTDVVQAYIGTEEPEPGRPVRQLAGLGRITLGAGAYGTARVTLTRDAVRRWNPDRHRWDHPAGRYVIWLGASSADLYTRVTVTIDAAGNWT